MATTTLSFNQIAAASSVDMVNSFAQDFSKLREMLAHSQFSVLPNGTNLTVAAKTATLQDGIAAENAEIPASTIVGDASIVTLTYKKYRALIGFERIATEGEGAVVNADNLLRGQLQGDVKQAIADGLATTCSERWTRELRHHARLLRQPVRCCRVPRRCEHHRSDGVWCSVSRELPRTRHAHPVREDSRDHHLRDCRREPRRCRC